MAPGLGPLLAPKQSLGPKVRAPGPDCESDEMSAPLDKTSEPSLEFAFESTCKSVPGVSESSHRFASELAQEFVPDLASGKASTPDQKDPVLTHNTVH